MTTNIRTFPSMKFHAAVVGFLQRQTDIYELIDAFLQRFVPTGVDNYVTPISPPLGSGAYCDRL
jgi:hypothetical protein